jgi:hypothetical protein
MAIIYTPGNAKPSQVLAGAKFSAGSVYNGAGTMRDMGGQEMSTGSAYMEEGYLSMSVQGLGGGVYAAVDDSTQLTFASPVQIRASNIIQGIEMLGLDGTATSDATATAADIKSGVVAYSKGQRLVGTGAAGSIKVVRSTYFNVPGGQSIVMTETALTTVEMIVIDDRFTNQSPHALICRRPGASFASYEVKGQATSLKVSGITFNGNLTFTLTNPAGYAQDGYLISYGM